MDAKTIGNNIAELRKKVGLTQAGLAEKLNVSDKAVSKWENGQGYPDVTVFPKLASLFGVTIDSLMLGEKKGIAIAGNIIADIVKSIDCYPEIGMLTNISDISYAVGGCVSNTAIDLAKIDRSIKIDAIGMVGTDEYGKFIVSQLIKNGVNTDGITYSDKSSTSFCDVMSLPGGERTFFHNKGVNSIFCPDDIDIDRLNCSIFHIGYILLLDKFDEEDKEYGTKMARFLHKLQKKGIKTSVDVVSNSSIDYGAKIIPALKYSNYAIINEIECCKIWDIEAYDKDGKILKDNIKLAMTKMMEAGVSEKIIIHSKEISFALDVKTKEFTELPSLKIPKELIKGSVGAGDAFCAGSLYGIYNEYTDMQILEFASSAAACNLFAVNSVDGMKSKEEIVKMESKFGRLEV